MKEITNKILNRKYQGSKLTCTRLFFILMLGLFLPNIAKAQPGWEDLTTRYYYTILDGKGNEISFKKDKSYNIIIDNLLYKTPNIPNDSLKQAIEKSHYQFDNYIRINDLSLRIPQNLHKRYYPLEIKIIHKKDTMCLNQSTGIGSTVLQWEEVKGIKTGIGHHKEPPSDITLQFISGYYYFPNWFKSLYDELPLTSGKVKIVNVNQRHFLIPRALYHSLASSFSEYRIRDELSKKEDEWVYDNFINGYFTVEKRIEPATSDKSFLPFKKSGYSNAKMYPTKNSNEYMGLITYQHDTLNYSGDRGVFSIYNKKDNTLKQWSPTKNARLSSTGKLYPDTFNNILYNVTIIRDSSCVSSKIYYDCPFKKKYFRSEDEGKNWAEDQTLNKLFGKYEFREFEFLDKNHDLGFTLRTIKHKTKKYNMQQGTYYLLENMQVIDSLKTPDDIHYNDNENKYAFSLKNDTIYLGAWGFDRYTTYGNPYFQPMIIKTNNAWGFQVKQETFVRPVPKIDKDTIKEYQNFKILNKREMVFKNGSGTLKVKRDVVEKPEENGIHVIEKDNQIYLLNNNFTYISFDGGTTWFIYPKDLVEGYDSYKLLEIDDQSVISYFNNSKLHKVFHKFSVKKKVEVKK